MIPKNLTRLDILQAIKKVDANGIPLDRISTKWIVLHDCKHYPPKYLISIANPFRNNEEWDSNDFSGGPETNQFLKSMGFEIVEIATKKIHSLCFELQSTRNIFSSARQV